MECPFEVFPAERAPASVAATMKRTITVWSPPLGLGQLSSDTTMHEHEAEWPSAPWTPDTRLQVGQLVDVVEEVTLGELPGALIWQQAIPPVCNSMAGPLAQPIFIGPRQPDQDGTMIFRAANVAAGVHSHRYFLAVVRPGVAAFPAPQLRTGQATLPVNVVPEVQLVVPMP